MLSDYEFKQLLDYSHRSWEGYRRVRKGVKKRIRRDMNRLGVTSVSQYIAILESSEAELNVFESNMGVTISRFFRDQYLWERLHHYLLPKILRENRQEIKIWVVGCASGEEVYSLSILFDMLREKGKIHIVATDYKSENLHRAQVGIYNKSSLKEVPENIKETYFTKKRNGKYAVAPFLGENIDWRIHDLFTEPPERSFHIIFLRNNLLTYHQGQPMENALQEIISTMVPNGYLVIGQKEKVEPKFGLIPEQSCQLVYKIKENTNEMLANGVVT